MSDEVPPLAVAIAGWLDAKSQRSASAKTARAYSDGLHAFRAVALAAGIDLDGDAGQLALLAQAWAGRNDPAPATYNQRLAILSSFYTYGQRHGLLSHNPIARVERRPVQSYASAAALDYATLKRRLAAIDRSTLAGQRDYALLAVGLQVGRRVSELGGVRWRHLHLAAAGVPGAAVDQISVVWERTKGGKTARDQLTQPVSAALMIWLHHFYGAQLGDLPPDGAIWCSLARQNRGAPMTTQAIADVCAKRLGTSKVHTLRHTFARAMEDAGAKVSEIQARLGHSSLVTTGRYLAALRSDENRHADAIVGMFGIGGEDR
jgi:integrase